MAEKKKKKISALYLKSRIL